MHNKLDLVTENGHATSLCFGVYAAVGWGFRSVRHGNGNLRNVCLSD